MTVQSRGFIDRYQAVGLQRNPFVAAQLPAAGDFDSKNLFVDRGIPGPPPPYSKSLVQVIGDSGLGKSSQIQRWRADQPGPLHYIPRSSYRSRWASPPTPANSAGTIYGDEIDRMPATVRARWFAALARTKTTLIIATHQDLTRIAKTCGFEVITHQLTPVDSAELRSIVDQRFRTYATSDDGPQINLDDATLEHVLLKSGGNPGAAEVVLHQLVAHLVHTAG